MAPRSPQALRANNVGTYSGRSSMQEADLPATNAFTGEHQIRFITSDWEFKDKLCVLA